MADSRSRSASPAREEPRAKKQKTGGFKWKEKKSKDTAEGRDAPKQERGGYRNRSPQEEGHREREQKSYHDDRPPRRRDGYEDEDRDGSNHQARRREGDPPLEEKASTSTSTPSDPAPSTTTTTSVKKEKKPKKPKPASQPVSTEPMIIVNINDRLGTKAAIPCLASDSIKAFKAVVAAHIGRQPHEIMLKRQGERPFKDQLSLQDYGVSNGVQLDLELDTGD